MIEGCHGVTNGSVVFKCMPVLCCRKTPLVMSMNIIRKNLFELWNYEQSNHLPTGHTFHAKYAVLQHGLEQIWFRWSTRNLMSRIGDQQMTIDAFVTSCFGIKIYLSMFRARMLGYCKTLKLATLRLGMVAHPFRWRFNWSARDYKKLVSNTELRSSIQPGQQEASLQSLTSSLTSWAQAASLTSSLHLVFICESFSLSY